MVDPIHPQLQQVIHHPLLVYQLLVDQAVPVVVLAILVADQAAKAAEPAMVLVVRIVLLAVVAVVAAH